VGALAPLRRAKALYYEPLPKATIAAMATPAISRISSKLVMIIGKTVAQKALPELRRCAILIAM
jgi:hypothetical protein